MRGLLVGGALLMVLAMPAAAGAQQPWSDPSLGPDRRADLVLDAMTLAEKAELMSTNTGTSWAYYNAGIERLGIPSLRMLDAGAGLRLGGVTLPETENRATAMPSPMLLAAAFDPSLAARYGRTVADEVREVGGNLLLGPNADTIRNPWWGRASETESEDPFLAGRVVGPYVGAVKDRGVIADLKHYNLYTQEINRGAPYDVRADERTVQEIYTPPWKAAVDNGLGSTMCSFNELNGDYACQNRLLLTDILKRQLGFDGFVLTDFGAAHSTVQSLNNGLDMETGNRQYYTPETIIAAVESGQVTEATIDEHVHRILRTMFEHGLFEDDPAPSSIPVEEHGETAREIAERGITLLKNSDAALPFDGRRLGSVAVIGGDANRARAQGGASHVKPTYEVSLLDGIRDRAPAGVDVQYAPGSDPVGPTSMLPGPAAAPSAVFTSPDGGAGLRATYFASTDLSGDPIVTRTDPGVRFDQGFIGGSSAFASLYGSQLEPTPGAAGSARYSGTFTVPTSGDYTFALTGWGEAQMFLDGERVIDFASETGDVATERTATLSLQAGDEHEVVIEYRATRAFTGLEPASLQLGWTHPAKAYSPDIQDAVEAARDADVAVVFAATFESEQRDRASLTLPNDQDQLIRAVSAVNPNTVVVLGAAGPVLMPWLGGVDAVVDSYFAGQEQGNAIANVLFGDVNPSGKLPITFPRSERQPEQIGIENPWDTRSDLTVPYDEGVFVGYRGYDRAGLDPLFPFGHGLSYTSFAYRNLAVSPQGDDVRVRFTLRNTGRRTGAEAAQVYVGQLPTSVPTPPKQLAGFAKVTLDPDGRERVTVTLDRRAFSYFDEDRNAWVTPGGRVPIYVGSSSRDIRLTGSVTVAAGEEVVSPRGQVTGIGGKCVDVTGGDAANGTPIQLYDCNGTAAQRWSVTPDGTLEALGKCLDVAGGATANGSPVQLYECNGSGAQQWEPAAGGTLRNPQSGRCLDATGESSANGTRLIIWDCHGGTNQRWALPEG
jgi:beta-glucosidase